MQAALQHQQHARCAGICSSSGRAWAPSRPSYGNRPSSSARAARAAAGPSADPQQQSVPVVTPVVLPPPTTGSQYTWRWRSPVSDASPPGGSGGRGTGSRGRRSTRDWGQGPAGSNLLFALLFRVRMLVVYGIWITLMYGVVHTTVGLMTGAGHTVAGVLTWALHGRRGQQQAATASNVADGAGTSSAMAETAQPGAADEASAAGVHTPTNSTGASTGSAAGEPVLGGNGSVFGSGAAAMASAQQGHRGGLLRDVLMIYVLVMGSVLFIASN